MDSERLARRLLPVIGQFDSMDLTNRFIVMGLNAVVAMALRDELKETSFDADGTFVKDSDPYYKVNWWQTMTGDGDTIIFRFNPCRVDDGTSNHIAAYNRAMKII